MDIARLNMLTTCACYQQLNSHKSNSLQDSDAELQHQNDAILNWSLLSATMYRYWYLYIHLIAVFGL